MQLFRLTRPVALCGLLALLAPTPAAQTVSRVIPAAAAPGDVVILEGTGLEEVDRVEFFARVGGFVGSWTVRQNVLTASATRVTVEMPVMAAFIGPDGSSPGDPNGSLRALTARGSAAPKQIYFLQGTFFLNAEGFYENPQTSTLGQGTSQSTGQGRAVSTFDVASGPPASGNGSFTTEVENAVPSVAAVAMLGLPLPGPTFPAVLDGTFVIDPTLPLVTLGSVMTDAAGDASLPLPIPLLPPLGVTLALQWAVLDGALPTGFGVSNGLVFLL